MGHGRAATLTALYPPLSFVNGRFSDNHHLNPCRKDVFSHTSYLKLRPSESKFGTSPIGAEDSEQYLYISMAYGIQKTSIRPLTVNKLFKCQQSSLPFFFAENGQA
jgi:hypothetical protein